jgi:hypothetical protein
MAKNVSDDVQRDRTSKCVTEIAELVGSKLARNHEDGLEHVMGSPEIVGPTPQGHSYVRRTPEEYRTMADECLHWAREPLTEDALLACLTLARVWSKLAMMQDTTAPDYCFVPRIPSELPCDAKVIVDDCRGIIGQAIAAGNSPEHHDVGNELCEFQVHSGGARTRARRFVIFALIIGAIGAAGAVLALIGQPVPQTSAVATNNSPTELSLDGRKVDGEASMRTALPILEPLAASASQGIDSTSSIRSDTSAVQPAPIEPTAAPNAPKTNSAWVKNKEAENAPVHSRRGKHLYARVAVRYSRWRYRHRWSFFFW